MRKETAESRRVPLFIEGAILIKSQCICLLPLDTALFHLCFFFSWPPHAACGILVSHPGVEPMPPAVAAQSLNHWIAREVLRSPLNLTDGLNLEEWTNSVPLLFTLLNLILGSQLLRSKKSYFNTVSLEIWQAFYKIPNIQYTKLSRFWLNTYTRL